MKAYIIRYWGWGSPYSSSEDLVYANTKKGAITKFVNLKSVFADGEWGREDVFNVQRFEPLDKYENLSDMELAEILITKYNREWSIPTDYHYDREHLTYVPEDSYEVDKDNFNKEEFEKAWKNEIKWNRKIDALSASYEKSGIGAIDV